MESGPAERRRRWANRWWLVHLGTGMVLSAVYALWLPEGSLSAAVAYTATAAMLAGAGIAGVVLHRPRPAAAWTLNAVAWMLNLVASAWWSFGPHLSGAPMPFPSPADGVFLATYAVLLAMLIVIGRQRGGSRDRGGRIDALIVTIAVGTMSWAFVIEPTLTAAGADLAGRAATVAYAIVDVLVIGTLVRVWFLPGVRRPAYLLLTVGVLLQVVSDEGYNASVLADTSAFGQWYDVTYLLAWSVIGAAPLHPSMRVLGGAAPTRTLLTRGRLAFLAAAALLPPVVIVAELKLVGHLGQDSRLALTCVSAVMSLLVLLRMRDLLVDISRQREMERLKNEFTSVVSHELRTPLTSIRGSLGLMAGGALGEMPPQAQRMLDIAVRNTDRLIRLINDILDLERIESGEVALALRSCVAGDVVAEAVRGLEGMARDAGVRVEAAGSAIAVTADPDRLVQTLTNLIGNAIKFSAPGTRVRASVEGADGEALFRVEDQGRGIPPDKLDSIFGAFEQVDASDSREQDGTGLGLAISRMIVERHGGRIWAESTLGAGSTFAFTIPAPAPVAAA
jgi:signal transduction histidine kinase